MKRTKPSIGLPVHVFERVLVFATNHDASLTATELRMLKVQLYLLNHRVIEMEKAPRPQKNSA